MFFDEPTTGLDSSMSLQCISLLKQLSNQGRTIICTIHQPSALIFELFDQLYAIADGQCIYSGAPRNLVSFLSEQGLKCSEFHNPSDFLLEISTNDYGVQNPRLVQKIDNGRNCNYRKNQTVPLGEFDRKGRYLITTLVKFYPVRNLSITLLNAVKRNKTLSRLSLTKNAT